eukprot:2863380-Pleurochrysis_carterae.AAC.2
MTLGFALCSSQHERRAAATLLPQLGELARVQQAQQQQLMQLTEALCALSSGADGSTNAPCARPPAPCLRPLGPASVSLYAKCVYILVGVDTILKC